MKKKLVLTTLIGISFLSFGNEVFGVESSKWESDAKIKFNSGEGIVTPPVDPTDPDNPVPPVPVDPTDPDNPGTGQKGPLSVDYVSNLKFGEHKITGKTISYKVLNQNPFIQVTDTRGAGDGWNLSAKMTVFSSKKNQVLKGATLTMKNGVVKAGSSSNISVEPINSDVLFDNEDSKVVLNAKDKAGRGTWLNVWSGTEQANEAIQLKVIAGSAEANTEYTSSITWSLEDAPK